MSIYVIKVKTQALVLTSELFLLLNNATCNNISCLLKHLITFYLEILNVYANANVFVNKYMSISDVNRFSWRGPPPFIQEAQNPDVVVVMSPGLPQ